jgi:hypothetical protein
MRPFSCKQRQVRACSVVTGGFAYVKGQISNEALVDLCVWGGFIGRQGTQQKTLKETS